MADAIPVRVALVGATGRMGRAIATLAATSGEIEIVAAIASARSTLRGRDLGELTGRAPSGIRIRTELGPEISDSDVVLDFSHPDRTKEIVQACRAARRPLLVGTTGQPSSALTAFEAAAREIALLIAPNTSIGANVLMELVRGAARALSGEFDVEIAEAHHRHKRDAPSGTALALGESVAQARGTTLAACRAAPRESLRTARQMGEIGFAVTRGGDLVGDHEVRFIGEGETLSLAHCARDRLIFARGAVRAAVWLAGQPPGRYGMADVLGFAEVG
jgi:4-hydroxy-tetrahydrodipicolinate reductase